MIKRIYIHNFRCLENFELPTSGMTSLLLLGKNGAGKSSVGFALQVLQSIARGTNRVGQLVNPNSRIDSFVKQVLEDFEDIKNPNTGKDSRSLLVQFQQDNATLSLPFEALSDGEKCFFICAMVLASNAAYGPLLCFWDEPDNFLSLSEVGHFVMELRRAFQSKGGQLIVTSHNPEAIRQFSDENTIMLSRRSHLEPTLVRRIADVQIHGDPVNALIRNDVEQ